MKSPLDPLCALLLTACLQGGTEAGDEVAEAASEEEVSEPVGFFARSGTDGLVVERLGLPPVVLSRTPVRTESACGFKMSIPELVHIGDKATVKAGLGRASPLVLEQGGQLLGRRVDQDLGSACLGLFAQPHRYMLFSPRDVTSPAAAEKLKFRIGFSEELPLDAAGGDMVWWVYPGTQVRMSVPEDLGEIELSVSAEVLLFGEGAAPRIWIDDESQGLVGGASSMSLSGTVTGPDWNVGLSSPTDGPFVAIRRLTLASQGVTRTLIGAPGAAATMDLESLSQPLPAGERLDLLAKTTLVASSEPLPGAELEFLTGRDGWARAELSDWAFLSAEHLKELGLPLAAGPLRIYEGDRPLEANQSCRLLRTELRGASCVAQGLVYAASTDGHTPGDGATSYRWGLDPDRSLPGGTWLYGGDHLELELPAGELMDATHLAVWVTKVSSRTATLSLEQGGEELLVVELNSSKEGASAFALPDGFDPYGDGIRLMVDDVDGLLAVRQLLAIEAEADAEAPQDAG